MPVTLKRTSSSDIGKGLSGLKAKMAELSTRKVQVGVLDGAMRTSDRRYENGELTSLAGGETNNATVGLNMEYGIASDGPDSIPARSFLRMPIGLHMSDPTPATPAKDMTDVPRYLADKSKALVVNAFDTGGFGAWAPNAKGTIAAKGRNEPGVDTGQLRAAINSRVV